MAFAKTQVSDDPEREAEFAGTLVKIAAPGWDE